LTHHQAICFIKPALGEQLHAYIGRNKAIHTYDGRHSRQPKYYYDMIHMAPIIDGPAARMPTAMLIRFAYSALSFAYLLKAHEKLVKNRSFWANLYRKPVARAFFAGVQPMWSRFHG